jgi:3',5'-cyclic AMP phosphodiesterase CpdA
MSNPDIASPSRRTLLKSSLFAGAALATGTVNIVRADEAATKASVKSFRIAHLTDMHVRADPTQAEGWTAAMKSLAKLSPKPDLIVTGGDHVMDALGASRERVEMQWDVYQKVWKDNTDIPSKAIIGNHDVWGWSLKEPIAESTAGYGKAVYLDKLQLKNSYHSFDAGGWHFIALDNIARRGSSYYGDLDAPQLDWLKADLAKTGTSTPICVFSHIPLVSIASLFFTTNPKEFWRTTDNLMHRDSRPLVNLLRQYNTKLALSGHIHLLDRVEFFGMTFICDGAVSGAWWKGLFQDCPEGYGILDFHPDGSFTHQYATYGWTYPKKA